jgi:uncharacterized SAM-binding protein YcdF (DUF218 family)
MSRAPSSRRRRRLGWRIGIWVVVVVGISWLAGLVWFASLIPRPVAPPTTKSEAIVVLTGGSDRMAEGLRLLESGLGQKLFVSGVYHGVEVQELLRVAKKNPDELECCVELGYTADNTAGNARETAAWMTKEGYRSLRLVTANYHMPRSLIEFHRAMPEIDIIVHPVFPERFKHDEWWLWPGSTSLIASEFGKYLLALIRIGLA